MNERLKELEKQSVFYHEDEEYWDFDRWKFAELIVRECMDICAEREYDIRTRIKDEGKAATAYMIRAYIKEHFGVEE